MAVYLGPCTDAAEGAGAFIESRTLGMAFVDESNYLSCPAGTKCATVAEGTGPGYRDLTGFSNTNTGDGAYSYMMSGNLFGTDWGFYGACTSYFNLGRSNITISEVDVYTASPKSLQRVSRLDSTMGAPHGPSTGASPNPTSTVSLAHCCPPRHAQSP